jgi:hypothetical protein
VQLGYFCPDCRTRVRGASVKLGRSRRAVGGKPHAAR